MAYATRADIEAIYGARHLETLVPSDVDLDTAVARALDAAEGMINPYLRKRYNLPLAVVPAAIRDAAIDIACWKLAPASDRLSEEIAKRAALHLALLKDIAAGKADLDELEAQAGSGATAVPGGENTAGSEGGAQFISAPRRDRRTGL
jgi:phage gp36-like protein